MSSSRVGSVFLGDLQRLRHLSSSPPSTAVYNNSLSPSHESTNIDIDSSSEQPSSQATPTPSPASPAKIDPSLALELRLRWLEALVLGVKQDVGIDRKGKAKEDYSTATAAIANLKHGETLSRLAEIVQQKLDKAVQGNEGLTKFMNQYDKHAPLLMPSFMLPPDPPTYDKMSAEEIDAFLTEMEPEIRTADRDMLEVEALEKKGVTGAGRLLEHEELQPRLKALLDAHEEDARLANSLETRIASLVERHATYVDALSELFVAWDDTITEAEDKLARMERDRTERLRLGFEFE